MEFYDRASRSVVKLQKNEGGPFGEKKIRKIRTMPKKLEGGPKSFLKSHIAKKTEMGTLWGFSTVEKSQRVPFQFFWHCETSKKNSRALEENTLTL